MTTVSSRRAWVVLSSSSGQTFYKVWRALKPETRGSFKGLFVDRKCEALNVCKEILPVDMIHDLSSPNKEAFEAAFLNSEIGRTKPLIFMIGYYRLVSANFLQSNSAVINTHPSLLPAFPGLDKKVHEAAFANSLVSGFSVHLVNEEMDAGPIIFQKSVDTSQTKSAEELRQKVREVEQKYLPQVIDQLVQSDLQAVDRQLNSRELQNKKGFPIICVD
jgi:phosphoribosylglycinamide formyltransferase-1